MPNVPPGAPIAPGVAGPGDGFPQYGVGGGHPGSAAGWHVVTATDEAAKMRYTSQGYLTWFSTAAAAQSFISSESSGYGAGQVPSPLSGLAAIGDFFGRLGQANTWIRVGEVLLGLVLLAVGVARITHAVPAATKIAKTVGAVAI